MQMMEIMYKNSLEKQENTNACCALLISCVYSQRMFGGDESGRTCAERTVRMPVVVGNVFGCRLNFGFYSLLCGNSSKILYKPKFMTLDSRFAIIIITCKDKIKNITGLTWYWRQLTQSMMLHQQVQVAKQHALLISSSSHFSLCVGLYSDNIPKMPLHIIILFSKQVCLTHDCVVYTRDK